MGAQPMKHAKAEHQGGSAVPTSQSAAREDRASAETIGPDDRTIRFASPVRDQAAPPESPQDDRIPPLADALPGPAARRWGIFRTTGSISIDAYRLVLFLLILVYYGGWVVAIFKLTELSLRLPSLEWFDAPGWFVAYFLYLRLMAPFLYRATRHVWRGMIGLVTSQHDDANTEVDGVPLAREEHPELYSAVGEVARRVGAPAPDEILVTHQAECYVTERRNFAVLTDRRLVLVVGLPHLCVLSVAEMQVILAHELAHFRRGDTSLGVFAFRFLESLRAATAECGSRRRRWFDPLHMVARLYFHLFLFLSAPIRRFQELRADGFSAVAYGGDLASRTLLKEWHLALQFDGAVASFEPEEDSSDDGPALTVFDWFSRDWRGLSEEGQAYLERRLSEEERPTFSDSHPTTAARIAALRGYGSVAPSDSRPARQLVPNIRYLKRQLHDRVFGGATQVSPS